LRSGVDGGNGVYKYGTSGFPTSSYNGSNYWVDVLFKAGTATARIADNTTQTPLEAKTINQKLAVRVTPNPTASYFTLFTTSSDKSLIQLRVIDALGRVVETKKGLIANGSAQIGHAYRPGVYYLQAVQGNEKVTVKLVKQSQ